MIALSLIITGSIDSDLKNNLENHLKVYVEKNRIFGWCKIESSKILIHLESDKITLSHLVSELQVSLLINEKNVNLNISNTIPKQLNKFSFIEKDLCASIGEDLYLGTLLNLSKNNHVINSHITNEITRNIKYRKNFYENQKFPQIIRYLPSKYLPEEIVSKGDFYKFLPLSPSFSSKMTEYSLHRSTFARHAKYSIEATIDDKATALSFVSQLNVPVPKVYQNKVKSSELDLHKTDIVIKPIGGHTSKDVFIVTADNVVAVENRTKITKDKMVEKLNSSTYPFWMVEQYIKGEKGQLIPYDIKVFCFYGVVKLILIIDRNNNNIRHEWLNEKFESVDTGRFNNSLFTSGFNNAKVLEYSQTLSLSVPTPFMRIDFLASEDHLYFGEFTPRPGHFHDFNLTYDSVLGNSFVAAQARLFSDLLDGKEFKLFNKFVKKKTV